MIYSAKHTEELEAILVKLETIYSPLMELEEYHSENVEDVIGNVFSFIDTLEDEDEQFSIINANATPFVSELSYLVHMSFYYGLQVVVFDNFPNILQVSRFVFKLTKYAYVNSMNIEQYKEFLALLVHVDEERIEHKFGLPYRLLKLLFILTLYKAVVGASVLSKFILHQIALSAKIST